ncbi:hypothetical protein [Mesorhizobium sp.]|uniref:hypothetical protein n=1 Tax=Mesorhizobium sp. TaxID=1871066 RepID=UPI000FE4121A|nr:hypothetical protein [Mesorhizobium sp.]RWH68452.1 MAG: hypothetical protein EOQ84_24840 [Mesorhizobium sp.]RWL19549.1 MAG: hypothetical protein EOR58_32060 [Mesorhizobium sp.]RWL27166.1 MAG: hypothetical protein EOR63_22645 [Mesorhizobium sp.]RWL31455.1 MAG: hypothetical protein EOR59_27625 [Mesorhizobium sp.]RWL43426.1 MAG: hypothetical protein EOR61_31035 [Mesorhizobium sp.]
MEAEHAKRVKQDKRREEKAHASWVAFWRKVAESPDAVFADDRATNTAWNLWQAVTRSGEESRASGWDRHFIEGQFGKATADRLREIMMGAWRKDKPTLSTERPIAEKNTFLVKWQFGLAGIAAEAEDPNWAKWLSDQEAELACRYAPIELNGFPSWLESLAIEHPSAIDRILGQELSLTLGDGTYSIFLQNIDHASSIVSALFVPRIRAWLSKISKRNADDRLIEPNVRRAIAILIKNGNDDDRRFIEMIAVKRLQSGISSPRVSVWLAALFYLNPIEGLSLLTKELQFINSNKKRKIQIFATLFDTKSGGIGLNLKDSSFTPKALLEFIRIAYQYAPPKDDPYREGMFSPDVRDDAQQGRNAILSALLAATGPEGWNAKLELARDPMFAEIKDRIIAIAEKKAAEEADVEIFDEAQFVVLDRTGEAPPSTAESMFALMRDRLDDIEDLLLQDTSPREAWADISDEHVMRRELARELKNAANNNYTVDQESVTADEKETDIRLRSTASKQQGVIELKLGDNRPATDLFNTIKDQLLMKYMAPSECRSGCLLITIAKHREWEHPITRNRINFEELITILHEQAGRLSKELGGDVKLMVKGLDLRPRLLTEEKRKKS